MLYVYGPRYIINRHTQISPPPPQASRRAISMMNTTLLLFLSTVCGLLSLLILIYIGKQVARLITRRTSPSLLPVRGNTRSSESTDSIDVPLSVRVPQAATAALPIHETGRHVLLGPSMIMKKYDQNMQPLAYPANVIYANDRKQDPSLVATVDDRT